MSTGTLDRPLTLLSCVATNEAPTCSSSARTTTASTSAAATPARFRAFHRFRRTSISSICPSARTTPPGSCATLTSSGPMSPESPRDRSGYAPEDVEQVKSACLTIVSILGSYLDGLCVIGGLVPLLLIDLKQGLPRDEAGHPG